MKKLDGLPLTIYKVKVLPTDESSAKIDPKAVYLPFINKLYVDVSKCIIMEYNHVTMTQGEEKVVLVGPCNPCFTIGTEHSGGMFLWHYCTEQLLKMTEEQRINEFKPLMKVFKEKFKDVKSIFIFTRPYWDQPRKDLYECQFHCAEILKIETEKLLDSDKCKYLIWTGPYGPHIADPYIAVINDGEKFSLAIPRDLSFVALSFGNGDGVSFKILDEAYAKLKERLDKEERGKNYFAAMKVFMECFVNLMPTGMLTDGVDAMDWFFQYVFCCFKKHFRETGQVAELPCFWEDKINESEIRGAFDAIKGADKEIFVDKSFSIFLQYISTKYYKCALLFEHLEQFQKIKPLLE